MKDDKRYAKYYDQSLRKSEDGGVRVDAVLDRIEARGEKRGIAIGENKGVALCAGCIRQFSRGSRIIR